MRSKLIATSLAVLATFVSLNGGAKAQEMYPMKKSITSYTDYFSLQLFARNPYDRTMYMGVRAYDQDWNPITNFRVTRPKFRIAPGKDVSFIAYVPFEANKSDRVVYICTETEPMLRSGGTKLRGQVCGKYSANQRRLQRM